MSPAELADEYGDINLQCDQFRSTYDRRDALRNAIQALYESHPADESARLEGRRWINEIKPKLNQDSITDIQQVKKALPAETFWGIVTLAMNRSLFQIKDSIGTARY